MTSVIFIVRPAAAAFGAASQFIRPARPIENAFIASFNGKCRDECLSVDWGTALGDAQQSIEAGRHDYSTIRRQLGLLGVEHASPIAE